MCVRAILDASAFRHFSAETRNSAGYQFRKWLNREDGIIVYTNYAKYKKEVSVNNEIRGLLQAYLKIGKAIDIALADLQPALDGIPDRPIRCSDDPHILALAVAGKATVLFSCDKKLCKDFADYRVIPATGRQGRRSLPSIDKHSPEETTGAKKRRKFLNSRRCTSC